VAERVKRRVAAARLAVAFVAAGTIAGATAWASAGPPPSAHSSASDIFAKLGDIKSEQIANHSLKYIDFAKGQVPSFRAFDKLDNSFIKYKKADNAFKYDVNGDLNTIKGELGAIKGELGSFVKTGDAIMGDGSVFTASQAVAAGAEPHLLLSVPNVIDVEALNTVGQPTQFVIKNTSNGDLDHAACGAAGQVGTLKPGETLNCATGQHTEALQLMGGSLVVTLNLTNIANQFTVQILVGL
jgi:hypothetical protein